MPFSKSKKIPLYIQRNLNDVTVRVESCPNGIIDSSVMYFIKKSFGKSNPKVKRILYDDSGHEDKFSNTREFLADHTTSEYKISFERSADVKRYFKRLKGSIGKSKNHSDSYKAFTNHNMFKWAVKKSRNKQCAESIENVSDEERYCESPICVENDKQNNVGFSNQPRTVYIRSLENGVIDLLDYLKHFKENDHENITLSCTYCKTLNVFDRNSKQNSYNGKLYKLFLTKSAISKLFSLKSYKSFSSFKKTLSFFGGVKLLRKRKKLDKKRDCKKCKPYVKEIKAGIQFGKDLDDFSKTVKEYGKFQQKYRQMKAFSTLRQK
jgi:hypothetical protein